jgi:hypothetical protein
VRVVVQGGANDNPPPLDATGTGAPSNIRDAPRTIRVSFALEIRELSDSTLVRFSCKGHGVRRTNSLAYSMPNPPARRANSLPLFDSASPSTL